MVVISTALLLSSCDKDTGNTFSEKSSTIELRSSGDGRYTEFEYYDTVGIVYTDYEEIEDRVEEGEPFLFSYFDTLLTIDSLSPDTFYNETKAAESCCDHLNFEGWVYGNSPPFPPAYFAKFWTDLYHEDTAVKYFYRIHLFHKINISQWDFIISYNFPEVGAPCEPEKIKWKGLMPGSHIGCPDKVKRIIFEKKWRDSSGEEHLCQSLDVTFVVPLTQGIDPCQ